jgi:hypothetical protein
MKTTPRNTLGPAAILSFTALLIFGTAGCKSTPAAPIITGNNPAAADGNLAPVDGSTTGSYTSQPAAQPSRALASNASYSPQQSSQNYGPQQQPAPIVQGSNGYPQQNNYNDSDQNYSYNAPPSDETDSANAQYDYAQQAPPPLPEYDQPPAPDDNYIWTPGYWAYGAGGYYWVPGTWCPPPYYGALWTPPYWGYYGGRYAFHHGYWGPHVGFYGGVNYGYGYIGIGFFGGYWQGNNFYYNRSVTNVGRVDRVYDREVVYNNVRYSGRPNNYVSYNGGRGGIDVRPRPAELTASREPHDRPIAAQQQVRQQSQQNRQQFFNTNHGRPAEAVVARPIGNNRGIAEAPSAVQQIQQRNAQEQQHNQPQQQNQQQQRNAQEQQQRTQQEKQNQQQQQRTQQEQQRNGQQPRNDMQRQNPQQQQQTQQEVQRTQQNQQQQRTQQEQQRNVQPQQQQRVHTQQPQPQRQQEQRPQPQPQQQREQTRPQAAPQQQRTAPEARPAPAPHAEAPHEEGHPK